MFLEFFLRFIDGPRIQGRKNYDDERERLLRLLQKNSKKHISSKRSNRMALQIVLGASEYSDLEFSKLITSYSSWIESSSDSSLNDRSDP